MWLVREGTIELTVNGKAYRLEPGSVGFVRSNEEHGIRNVGASAAVCFVVAVGPGAELQEKGKSFRIVSVMAAGLHSRC
jgi:quercetin dioxygenase-like cupin family protein